MKALSATMEEARMLGSGCTLYLLLKGTAREPGSWMRQDKGKESVLRFSVEFLSLCLLEKEFFLGHLKCQTCVVREGWKGRRVEGCAPCRALESQELQADGVCDGRPQPERLHQALDGFSTLVYFLWCGNGLDG